MSTFALRKYLAIDTAAEQQTTRHRLLIVHFFLADVTSINGSVISNPPRQ